MGDEEPQCKVEYLDVDPPEETNWIKRAGKCKVTYTNNHIFEGTYDAEKIKQGQGTYIWMGPASEEDETPTEKARFEGNYKDGQKTGVGRMVYPNGDVFEGEWLDNKAHGEGTYTYKKSQDIYSGSWVNGKKHGQGRYEFAADQSQFVGAWENGDMVSGTWELKGAGSYSGNFKLGRPLGAGKYAFTSGITQGGSYVEKKAAEGEEEAAEEGVVKQPNVSWSGDSIVSF